MTATGPCIHTLLEAQAVRTPDAIFLYEHSGSTSYEALQRLVETGTQDLLDAGVRPTDRVVLVAENGPAHIALIMACSRIGGVNARMSPGEIAVIVERADARISYYTAAASDAARVHADRSGRLKEMIIRSGFNVYPAEVEAVLNRFEGIRLSALVGMPETDGNEQIVAFVELTPGTALDHAALRAHLAEHLSPYKRPARVEVLDTIPTTANGKLLKRELQSRP